jgi:hypothetical protein
MGVLSGSLPINLAWASFSGLRMWRVSVGSASPRLTALIAGINAASAKAVTTNRWRELLRNAMATPQYLEFLK